MSSEGISVSGVITAVEVQKKDPGRVSVFVEGDFAFGVSAEVARQYGLRRGDMLAASTAAAALQADSARRAFDAAMILLAYRARTEFEVRQRLRRKGFDEDAVDWAVRRLLEKAYLDDRVFAREYATSRVASRGEGIHRIRGDLLRRGVAGAVVDEVISQLEPQVKWMELAREQAGKRWERLSSTGDPRKRKKKLLDYLVRKGFDYSVARSVMAEFEE